MIMGDAEDSGHSRSLKCDGEKSGNLGRFMNDSRANLDSPVPDSRSGLIIGDFWLSQLVQCLLDFCLGIVCSDEDGHVLHACSDETGK